MSTNNSRGVATKEVIALSQTEQAAEQCLHESNIMALSQVIESLHKRVDTYSKLYAALSSNQFSIPFQVENTLDKISSLMEEIAEKEALMRKMST